MGSSMLQDEFFEYESQSHTIDGFQFGDGRVRTFAIEVSGAVMNPNKRSRKSSATQDDLNALLSAADDTEAPVFNPNTLFANSVPGTPGGLPFGGGPTSIAPSSPIAYHGVGVDGVGGGHVGLSLPLSSASAPTTTLINSAASNISSTTTAIYDVNNSSTTTVIASGSILNVNGGNSVSIEAFIVKVPFVDNEPCRALLPTFHRVDKSPEEFETEVRKFPALMMPARGDKKKQNMCDLLIKLYKTRYTSRNADDCSYYQTTQRFFYPKVDLWIALADKNAAKAFMDCTEHLTCVFCEAHFKLRNNTELYVGVAGHQQDEDSLRRPHQHTGLHQFLDRILQEKLWVFMNIPF